LAVPSGLHDELAQAADWQGKIVIDATNAYRVSLDELGGLPSSVVNPQALIGSGLVKAFQPFAGPDVAQDPDVNGGRRVTSCRATTTAQPCKSRPRLNNSGSRSQPRQARKGWFPRPSARVHLGSVDLPGFGQVQLALSHGDVTSCPTCLLNNAHSRDAGQSN
jgi:hypothetical protein